LELARDYHLDRKFGGWCGAEVPTVHPDLDARGTQSTHYWQLMRLFREVPIRESDFLVDVGCGYGRVINYWLHMGCRNRIVGVELNERVADRTRERLKGYPNVTIITGNVLDHIPSDANFFFLFNPFGEPVMERFKAILRDTSSQRTDLRVMYLYCVHRNLFDNDPDWEVRELRSSIYWETVLLRIRARGPGDVGSSRGAGADSTRRTIPERVPDGVLHRP
jgi:SAM-dependent methyltransferase